MSNPFYPPKRMHTETASRGSIGAGLDSQPIPFDPDRRAGNLTRPQQQSNRDNLNTDEYDEQYHQRQRTEGPGGAASFYAQDAPVGGDMPVFGSGTDGFGGAVDETRKGGQSVDPYANDYRHEFVQRNDDRQGYNNGQPYPNEAYAPPKYRTPAYEQSPQARTRLLEEDRKAFERENYSQQQLHLYPPNRSSSPSPQRSFMGDLSRPSTPGFYPDRAPKMEKLTESQKKIAKEFPTDLDEENGSLLKTAIAMVKDWRSWLKWKFTHYYIILVVIILLVAFMTIYHRQIIDWLTPVSQKVRSVAWGFVIPVAILFVISFPPLFGHEIVGVLLGVVYGLWIGFGILSLGTLLGEWGNFYAFKHFLRKHAERYERKSLNYACMAYIVREGGFLVILLARLSAIPGHFTTAVFATVGMGFFVFTLATLLSMPKQLLVVYLGVVIEQSGSGTEPLRSKIIKYAVLVLSGLVTVGVAVFLYGKMQQARPVVQAQLREKRFVMLTEAGGAPTASSEEGMLGGDEGRRKLYGQGDSGVYSTDDLESSRFEGKKDKGGSRWKMWGKKNKKEGFGQREGVMDSMESLEKAASRSSGKVVMEDGVRMSFEADSLGHSARTGETLKGNPNLHYVKSRPEQPPHQDERFFAPQPGPHANPYNARHAPNSQYADQGYLASSGGARDPRRDLPY